MSQERLKLALQRMIQDSSKKVSKTHFHTDDFVEQVDERIRVSLAQARSIKKNHEAYAASLLEIHVNTWAGDPGDSFIPAAGIEAGGLEG